MNHSCVAFKRRFGGIKDVRDSLRRLLREKGEERDMNRSCVVFKRRFGGIKDVRDSLRRLLREKG